MHIAIAESDDDVTACFPVMAQLRPHLVAGEFLAHVRRMEREGYRLAFVADDGAVRAVGGYRFFEKLHSGKHLYVDDLVTDGTQRSRGYGKALLDWLAEQARTAGCSQLELDSGSHRFDTHRFYFRERMHISSYHFVKALKR